MERFFKQDEYQTPSDKKRVLGDRLFLGSRWWFYQGLGRAIRECANNVVDGVLSMDDFHHAARRVFSLVEDCGGRAQVKGLGNIAAAGNEPIVFIGNHMSLLETVTMPVMILDRHEHPISFIVKRDLLEYPVFGTILKGIAAIGIGRDNPRDDLKLVLKEGKRSLENGVSMVIFPQSTRSTKFNPENFNSIGVKLAKSAGAPVVPFALKTDFLGNGDVIKDLGPIYRDRPLRFEFGEKMTVTGNGRDQHKAIVEFISERTRQWEAL